MLAVCYACLHEACFLTVYSVVSIALERSPRPSGQVTKSTCIVQLKRCMGSGSFSPNSLRLISTSYSSPPQSTSSTHPYPSSLPASQSPTPPSHSASGSYESAHGRPPDAQFSHYSAICCSSRSRSLSRSSWLWRGSPLESRLGCRLGCGRGIWG